MLKWVPIIAMFCANVSNMRAASKWIWFSQQSVTQQFHKDKLKTQPSRQFQTLYSSTGCFWCHTIWVSLHSFSALTLLVGQQEGHLACKKTEWWGTGIVIWLEQGANDLHLVQLMPSATPSSLTPVKSRMVYLSGAGLPRLSIKRM